jgi:hypothetical protein
MRHCSLVASIGLAVAGSAVVGCVLDDREPNEAATADLTAEERELARKAFNVIAGNDARCNRCHTAGRDDIVRWGEAMKTMEERCLAPGLALSAAERIDCLRDDPSDPTSGWSADKLGLYSGGADLSQLKGLFQEAYPDDWEARHAEFVSQAAMPLGSARGFTESDFTTIKSWVLRGMPGLDEVLSEPGASACVPKTTPALTAHMDEMKSDGWGARLLAASTPMAGCGSATKATDCLTSLPDLTATWGAKGTVQTLRELRKFDTRSSYWTRSSADGRFTAFGGSPSRIVDLEAPPDTPPVTVRAPYDPAFFPNNDGFSFAGTQAGGLRVCRQSVLLDALASKERTITFSEPGCTRIINTVYQSIGASLDGSLFFMATGAHTNDAGGSSGPLSAAFGPNATTTLTPMFNDGTRYVPGQYIDVKIPFEGDQQLSPSNKLLITRFGQRAGTSGYRIRMLTPTVTPAAANADGGASALPSVEVSTTEIATVCLAGGKPQLSFDERFLAVHQYTDPNDNPHGLPAGTSNIFVADLKTGDVIQVTNVAAGQKALYPHFRADGWLYFIVREAAKETLVASDVVLHRP